MMTPGTGLTTAALVFATGCATGSSSQPREPPAAPAMTANPTEGAGFYSTAQAERGRRIFQDVCYECHYPSEVRGDEFEWDWRRRTVRDLYREISRNMPEDFPGTLAAQTYVDVIAYILELNGYASGSAELAVDQAAMENIPLGPGVDKTSHNNDGGER